MEKYMRALLFGSMLVLMTAAFVGSPAAALLETDGFTASISGSGAPGLLNTIFQPNAAGNYGAKVAIFHKVGGVWGPATVNATLKVATPVQQSTEIIVDSDPLNGNDPLAKVKSSTGVGFSVVYSATFVAVPGGTTIFFPASAVKGDTLPANGFDLYVEIEGGGSSHHNLVKNRLIDVAQYDLADSLDTATANTINAIGL